MMVDDRVEPSTDVELGNPEISAGAVELAEEERQNEKQMKARTAATEKCCLLKESDAEADAEVEETEEPKFTYRPDIDGLRAFAVLSVVFYHMEKGWIPGGEAYIFHDSFPHDPIILGHHMFECCLPFNFTGFTGVDIFFVISGYVVHASLLHRASQDTCAYFSGFYARRMKRLTPSLSLFLCSRRDFSPQYMCHRRQWIIIPIS